MKNNLHQSAHGLDQDDVIFESQARKWWHEDDIDDDIDAGSDPILARQRNMLTWAWLRHRKAGCGPAWLEAPLGLLANARAVRAEATNLAVLLADVKSGKWREEICTLRGLLDRGEKNEYDKGKKALAAVQLSGFQRTRSKGASAEDRALLHSGLLQGDFDAKDHPGLGAETMKARLLHSPYVCAAFRSPGGGVRAVFRIPAVVETHAAAFAAVKEHVAEMGLVIDMATKDPGRLAFVSWDPAAGLNLAAVEIEVPVGVAEDTPFRKAGKSADSAKVEEARALLAMIPAPPPYDTWLRVISAVWAGCGIEQGSDLLDEWSPEPGGYRSMLHKRLGKVGFGTLHHLAEEAAPEGYARWKAQRAKPSAVDESEASNAVGEEPGTRFFYDGQRYFLDTGHEFVPMDLASVRRHLVAAGLKRDEHDGIVNEIQKGRYVTWAGPLAGHERGLHGVSGKRILVTSSPVIIAAAPGEWPMLEAVVRGLIGGDPDCGEQQLMAFFGWLKAAREALVRGVRRPGQALVLAGQRNCGKSLLIDLIARVLGGRRAGAHPYFVGKTRFNGDLAGAELLVVDDQAGSTDIRTRREFGANIKAHLFSGSVRIEGKGKEGFDCAPCWRLVIACNDEAENLLVLPPLTPDVADKLTMLKCDRFALPLPAYSMKERDAFFRRLLEELPAFLHFLEGLEIPAALRDERCGIAYFHHPDLVAALGVLSPEQQLLELIDSASLLHLPWEGRALELRQALETDPGVFRQVDHLLSWSHTACGQYLARLLDTGRVEKLPKKDGYPRWRVLPP